MRGHREDGSSLSSASLGSNSSSGAQSLSGLSSASSSLSAASCNSESPGSASGSSQMGFLDELKKLAERRSSNADGLLTDTLNKTKVGEGGAFGPRKGKLPLPACDEKRKQHG